MHPTLQHFRDAINRPFFWDGVENSLIVVSVTVALSMVLAFLAAVALAKFRFTGRKLFIVLIIGIQMLPAAGLIIPLYVVLARYHQVNALSGVILTYMTFVLPFSVWVLRGFLLGIPRELEEAAMVDGSSRLGAFTRILLPLVAPGLVATSVFAFITCWNEYIFARILLNDQSKQTATVWLSYFTGTSRNTDWGGLMAGVDADRRARDHLLPARAAEDRVRADRGLRQGLSAELDRLAAATLFPSFDGLDRAALGARPARPRARRRRAVRAERRRAAAAPRALRLRCGRCGDDVLVAIDEEGGDVTRLERRDGSSYPGQRRARRRRRRRADGARRGGDRRPTSRAAA